MFRNRDRHAWRWVSTNPGITIVSVASTISASRARRPVPDLGDPVAVDQHVAPVRFCVFTSQGEDAPPRRRVLAHAGAPAVDRFAHGLVDEVRRRHRQVLQRGRRGQRDVRRGDADARPVEGPERLLGDDRHSSAPHPQRRGFSSTVKNRPVFADRFQQRLRVERNQRPDVDDLRRDAVCARRSAASSARGTMSASAAIARPFPREGPSRCRACRRLAVGHVGLGRPSTPCARRTPRGRGRGSRRPSGPTMSTGSRGRRP